MRSAVPPRDLAATITARSVLRAGWAVAFTYLAISVIALVDLWISRAYSMDVLLCLASLLVVIAALIVLVRKPTIPRGAFYLAIGGVANFVYVYCLLIADPSLNDSGVFLLNRVTIALLLVGPASKHLLDGLVWCTVGFVVGSVGTVLAQVLLGLTPNLGYGPILCLAIYIVVIALFTLIRRSQRRFTPAISEAEAEAARLAGQRELEERAVALLHDTVLNDLAAIVSGKDQLDERARDRIRRDIDSVSSAQLESGIRSHTDLDAGALRDELLAILNEFQWRGLTVDVGGGDALSADLDPETAEALLGAVSGCLENIVLHSGSNSAELFIDATTENLSVMIADHGRGFDPDSVPENRLGIRRALIKRIEGCGGTVRIWSAVGSGTSIIITVPIAVPHG